MAETTAEFNLATAKKGELIAKLQEHGVEVNPTSKVEDLRAKLAQFSGAGTFNTPTITITKTEPLQVTSTDQPSELSQVLGAISTLVGKVDSIDKRLNRVETGGKDDFMADAKQTDIERATVDKQGVNPRIVQIVENTLGVDFGVKVEGNKENPGSMLTILVPQRLSPVPYESRPVRDENGKYKFVPGTIRVNPRTGLEEGEIMEEQYWPGDRRSVALGASDSYDVIQAHCNRVRSNIMAWYQKTSKPLPEFKTR